MNAKKALRITLASFGASALSFLLSCGLPAEEKHKCPEGQSWQWQTPLMNPQLIWCAADPNWYGFCNTQSWQCLPDQGGAKFRGGGAHAPTEPRRAAPRQESP